MQSFWGFSSPGHSSHLQHCMRCRDLWSYKSKEEEPAKREAEESRLLYTGKIAVVIDCRGLALPT